MGRRTLPHQLFDDDDVANYLANVERALDSAAPGLDAWDPDRWNRRRPG
ncbi:MAG TPA: hypothetical protein VMU64_10015 [Acidimicrobiales bacterium]|nr:hypothetical protein [Acidimicrobiales bacterium]